MRAYTYIELLLNSVHSHIFNNFCTPFSLQAREEKQLGDPLLGHFPLKILPTRTEKEVSLYIALSEK